ncbi:hypothetical protein FB567DRAFT_583402 [Paraphoma chrysanthemicola]|uniref:Secreted protein n=1 Tax=Paraphoma chrysanthemicola TaxID=798071 RepID=A0A8K0QY79_9PLEO|nr:hypothetical protein FB567DRAFT_583402 [Paraphoma chrysanthemicola]
MRFVAIFFACFTVVSAAPAASAIRPPKGAVSVAALEVDTKGGACKPGEVGVALAADNSALTLIFDNFQAGDGPNAPGTSKRSSCRVNIDISAPGWAFDIISTDFRGYIYLESGVTASLTSQWKRNNGLGKGTSQRTVNGPFDDDFLLHRDGDLSDTEASVCSKNNAKVTINLVVTVKSAGSKATGLVRGDSLDGAFGQVLNFAWKTC